MEAMIENTNDAELDKLLTSLFELAKEFGPRSDEVKLFIRQHKHVPEFPQLAATCLFIIDPTATKSSSKTILYVTRWGVAIACAIALGLFVSPYIGLIFALAWIAGFFNGAL